MSGDAGCGCRDTFLEFSIIALGPIPAASSALEVCFWDRRSALGHVLYVLMLSSTKVEERKMDPMWLQGVGSSCLDSHWV